LIDRIRHDIQERLDQLLGEADKLRRALVALGSRDSAPPAEQTAPKRTRAKAQGPSGSAGSSGSAKRKTATAQPATATAKRPTAAGSTPTPAPQARTEPGATKNAVLAALSDDKALTAGDVAAATGLGRATVSTTLSKLAKTGEVTKAQRGYQLTQPGSTATPKPDAQPRAAEPDQSEPASGD
jgi:CRP-like cAMP-binding protein